MHDSLSLSAIEAKLHQLLPSKNASAFSALAAFLSSVLQGTPKTISEEIIEKQLLPILQQLEGQNISLHSTQVSFGEKNQIGDVKIEDVIGGNKSTYTVNVYNYNQDYKPTTSDLSIETTITPHNRVQEDTNSPENKLAIQTLLSEISDEQVNVNTWILKWDLLEADDRAHVLFELIKLFPKERSSEFLMAMLENMDFEEATLFLEDITTSVIFSGSITTKAKFLLAVPVHLLDATKEKIRRVLFQDVIDIMQRDQFKEVNVITPAAIRVQKVLPDQLCSKYVSALLEQANSGAYLGRPAARRALKNLPTDWASLGLNLLDLDKLLWANNEYLKVYIETYNHLWSSTKADLFRDYISLSKFAFFQKYYPDED